MRPGFKRFLREFVRGWSPSKDKKKFPEGVDIERVIDKEKRQYHQVVRDKRTGEITHEEHGPLDQHKRRNSHESS